MPINAGVQVPGLADFRRDLNNIDPALTKQLRSDLVDIGRVVAADAASKVPSRSGRAGESIKAGASGNNAYVQGGKKTVPYYGWLDFGSRKPVRGNPRSVGPWTKSGRGPKKGRFIYPAIEANRDKIQTKAGAAVDRAANEALKRTY